MNKAVSSSYNDIELPSLPKGLALQNTFEFLDELVTNIILYFAYGIALLCSFKLFIYILNGFASKSYMGARVVDDLTLFR